MKDVHEFMYFEQSFYEDLLNSGKFKLIWTSDNSDEIVVPDEASEDLREYTNYKIRAFVVCPPELWEQTKLRVQHLKSLYEEYVEQNPVVKYRNREQVKFPKRFPVLFEDEFDYVRIMYESPWSSQNVLMIKSNKVTVGKNIDRERFKEIKKSTKLPLQFKDGNVTVKTSSVLEQYGPNAQVRIKTGEKNPYAKLKKIGCPIVKKSATLFIFKIEPKEFNDIDFKLRHYVPKFDYIEIEGLPDFQIGLPKKP